MGVISSPPMLTVPEPAETVGLPDELYDYIPPFLRECCKPYHPGHERDILLLGVMGVLSGCFPNLTGIYDGLTVWANLYVFIIAPAANGKGGLTMARRLAYPTHAARVLESREKMQEYEVELELYNQHKRTNIGKAKQLLGQAEPSPLPPKFRQLYIPGNSSAASVLIALHDNDGQGIICESEGDTIAGPLKQDWGNFSDIYRKGFHHESTTSQRKTGREYLEVNSPKLSVVITSTQGQVQGIIPSAENGLFSRFLFYYCNPPQVWRDVGPDNGRGNLTQHFDQLAEVVTGLIADATEPVVVELTPQQWAALNEFGADRLEEAVEQYGEEAGSVIKRLGLILFRISMLLTLLRAVEKDGSVAGVLVCADIDFQVAVTLVDVCRRHALALFEQMPRERRVGANITPRRAKETQTEKALALQQEGLSNRQIAKQIGVSESTLRGWFKAAA